MGKNWINLHAHDTFSMLDGNSNIEKYITRTKELGNPAACETNHGNVHGLLDFYNACKELDQKPIVGMEGYQARKTRFDRDEEERSGPATFEWDQRGPYHITLLAKNKAGYHNLIKLSSYGFLEGYYGKPRIDYELLERYSEGIIILSGCLNGELQQALLRDDMDYAIKSATTMQDIVGKENYFVELQNHGLEEQSRVNGRCIEIAKMIGARIVPTGDTHYVHKEDHDMHDVLLCLSTGAKKADENRFKFSGPEFYLKSYDEMEKVFEPEWLKNTLDIGEMVDLELEIDNLHFPSFPDVPKEKTPEEHLDELVWDGLKGRYGDPLPQDIVDRAEYELRVIHKMGFSEYFLVVADLVNWAKNNNIRVGPGRGSAAGAVVSYALKITNLDPIRFGLLFERFLVEGRKQPPDIDLDFDSRYRERVIEYARQRYGPDNVCHIGTFTRVQAKTAIRDSARVLGYEYSVGDKLAGMIAPPIQGKTRSIDESIVLNSELADALSDPIYSHVIETARGLEGIPRQPGVHPAGVIIAPGPVIDYVPVHRPKKKGTQELGPIITQWDMYAMESTGLLKVDFLGLRNIDIMAMTLEHIKERHGIDIDIDAVALDDPDVYSMLSSGKTVGVFQLESGGMTEMAMDVQPSRFEDIMAIVSLFRPGPMGSGADKMYVNRKHGRQKVSYAHPKLETVLNETYGIMLYQEDVLNVTRVLGGWDAASADDLRKAIGKKLTDKIGLFEDRFVTTTNEVSGLSRGQASKIYGDIKFFAGYGFGRAHAASYAMIAYQTAWLKYHYPTEYMAALLTSTVENRDRLALYLAECRRLGIDVLAPSITESKTSFSIPKDNTILFGLLAIDGIGEATIDGIMSHDRDFTSVYDYMRKANPAVFKKDILEHLVFSGAFDMLVSDEKVSKLDRSDKMDLLEIEKSQLGAYVTDHPLLGVWEHLESSVTSTVADLESKSNGSSVKIGGLVSSVKKSITKKGEPMYRLRFEDLTGEVDVLVFPREAKKLDDEFLTEGMIGLLEARLAKEGDEENLIKLFYYKMEQVSSDVLFSEKPVVLKSSEKLTYNQTKRLCDIIKGVPGEAPVYLQYFENNHAITFRFIDTVDPDMADSLQQIVNLSAYESRLINES